MGVSGVEGKTYVITTVAQGGLFEIGQQFLEEAYKRIGEEVRFTHLPAERSLISSNAGLVDGEMFRVDNIHEQYTNLLKVPTSFIVAENVAFSKKLTIRIDGYISLKPYRIGFRRGLKIAEMSTKEFPRVYPVDETKIAFLMLNAGRVDVVIEERLTGLDYVKRLNLKGINVLEEPVDRLPLFHYVHKKNRDLVPKLDAVFQAMIHEEIWNNMKTEPID